MQGPDTPAVGARSLVLDGVERISRPIPEMALQAFSRIIVGGGARAVDVPQALRDLPGDLTVLLADSNFVSFAGPFHAPGKRVVGIKSPNWSPMSLPNVARNVIIHELGHAIGLGHNSDPAMLMCGRPADCRPAAFRSDVPRIFPLTDDEKAQLLRMYPADWKPRSAIGGGVMRCLKYDSWRSPTGTPRPCGTPRWTSTRASSSRSSALCPGGGTAAEGDRVT